MNIVVFGATGRIGSAITEKALEDGHFVTAFVRNLKKLVVKHDHLQIVQGDATDPAAVERAVRGKDAVISAMATTASGKIAKSKPLTRGMQNIIAAMEKCKINRLVMTAPKVLSQPEDLPDIRFKLMRALVKLMIPAGYADTASSVDAVMASNLDWTIVRVDRAAYTPPIGVKAGPVNKAMGIGITRGDAAAFILKETLERKYLLQTPAICSRRLKI